MYRKPSQQFMDCDSVQPQMLINQIISLLADSAKCDNAELRIQVKRLNDDCFGVELKFGGTYRFRVYSFTPENFELLLRKSGQEQGVQNSDVSDS